MSEAAPSSTHRVEQVPVTVRLDGSQLSIPVHEIDGGQPGPTLTVISGMHGAEWMSIETVRRFVDLMSTRQFRGRVLAIPVANPTALEHETRMTPDRSDEPDLNRVWPGGTTWLAEQMAARLTEAVIDRTDYLVDFHAAPWGSTLTANCYGGDFPDESLVRSSLELAVAFGYPIIRALQVMTKFPGPRSIEGYAGTKGIPALAPNLGGLGFAPEHEERWIDDGLRGLVNVARHVGMIEESLELPDRFFHFVSRGFRVVPTCGGMVEPVFGPEALGTEVEGGTLLGRVRSPYTFEVLEELRAPADGVLFAVARWYAARPGDWAFFVADASAAGSHWASGTGTVQSIAAELAGVGS